MSNLNPYEYQYNNVASAGVDERVDFIRKTYAHLAGAVMLFIVIECMAFMFTTVEQRMQVVKTMMGSRWGWLLVLGVFMGVSYIAERWAQSATSLGTQYLGLITYVVGEAVIFMPLLFIADTFYEGAIGTAAMITAVVFGGLTIFIFTTRTDLSGWGKYLSLLGFGAMGYILLGIFIYLLFSINITPYKDAIRQLSRVVEFFQGKRFFNQNNTPITMDMDVDIAVGDTFKFSADLFSLSLESSVNLWSNLNSKQLPNVIYKIRVAPVERTNITELRGVITENQLNYQEGFGQ